MAWFPDLEPISYFGVRAAARLRAVGWLEADHPFTRGAVERAAFARLFGLARRPWEPHVYLGWHDCSLCRFTEGPDAVVFDGEVAATGVRNLFIPAEGIIFVAPSMILHYISAHGYAPPDVFMEAVERCPPMGSAGYLNAIEASGGAALRDA